MSKIYRESFGYFLSSLPVLMAFAVMIEAMLWVMQPLSGASLSIVLLTAIAYSFHRHFLFGETLTLHNGTPAEGAPPMKLGWFILISAGLIVVPTGIALIVVFGFVDVPSPGVVILTLMPVYLVTLSLFGTALPATVARDGSYRLSHGLRATLQTMWRLVLGPGVVGAVLFAAGLASVLTLQALGVPEDSLIMLGYSTLATTFGFLSTIIAVAVLCEMYRRTRPDPQLGQGPSTPDQTPA
jgi:hypothetical protein